MTVKIIVAVIVVGLVSAMGLYCYFDDRKKQEKYQQKKRQDMYSDISNLRNTCSYLESQVSSLNTKRNAAEAELIRMVDTQFKMKLGAMNAGRAMIREAMRSKGGNS
jgi:peptidoglycan hydrolase CwlO-like protein